MLFPANPERRPELWGKFAEKVAAGAVSFLVHRSQILSDQSQQLPLIEGVDHVVNSFRSADVVRFGADRGQALGPFFALRVAEGVAHLVEYAIDPSIQSSSDEGIQEALQSLAINLFFENRDIAEISLPFVLLRWDLTEWRAVEREDGTTLQRAA